MSHAPQAFRPYMALAPIGVLYLAAVARMIALQFHFDADDGLSRVQSETELPAARGSILDRNGLVLAEDVTSWDLVINYRLEHRSITDAIERGKLTSEQAEERISILAEGTGIPFVKLWNALMVNPSSAQVMRRGLSPAARETVLRTLRMVKHSGLSLKQNFIRIYPNNHVLGHVIGLPGGAPLEMPDGTEKKDEKASPGSGLELGLEPLLAGTEGMRRAISVSGENGVNPALDKLAPVEGQSVRTTLDLALSTFARGELVELMQAHKPVHCFAIAVDVKNGQVLSMFGLPDYDANDPVNSMETVVSPFNGKEGLAGWTYPGKWRIAPGSTIKPLMASYALERGAIQPDQWFDDFNGRFLPPHRLRKHPITNSIGTPQEPMRAHEGIVYSSNIVFSQIARAIGREGMVGFGDYFGYHKESYFLDGLKTRLQSRVMPSSETLMRERSPDSLAYAIPNMGFGVNFSVPPMDHAMALASIANGGILFEATLDPRNQQPGQRILSEGTAQYVRTAMHEMAHLEKRKWLPHREELNYCGKSGTAELKSGPLEGRYTSLFCAYGPYEDPEILVLVVAFGTQKADRFGTHHFGSKVCGPAAVNILYHALEGRGSLATKSAETLDFKASAASLQRDE